MVKDECSRSLLSAGVVMVVSSSVRLPKSSEEVAQKMNEHMNFKQSICWRRDCRGATLLSFVYPITLYLFLFYLYTVIVYILGEIANKYHYLKNSCE